MNPRLDLLPYALNDTKKELNIDKQWKKSTEAGSTVYRLQV